jgi:hypothetical protein
VWVAGEFILKDLYSLETHVRVNYLDLTVTLDAGKNEFKVVNIEKVGKFNLNLSETTPVTCKYIHSVQGFEIFLTRKRLN